MFLYKLDPVHAILYLLYLFHIMWILDQYLWISVSGSLTFRKANVVFHELNSLGYLSFGIL